LEDVNGIFWIATTNGLVKVYPEGNWQLFSEKDGLPSANISCIYQDKEKNIWIGTFLGLAKLVTKNNIRIYPMKNELNETAGNFLLSLKNDLFLTRSGTGVQFYNNRDGLFSPVSSQHDFFYTGFVQNSSPHLFYGDNNRIGRYDSLNRLIIDHIPPASLVTSVYCSVMDTNGIIFNGTYMGLFIGLEKKFSFEKKLPFRITCLLIDKKGDLWVGTWDNGLYQARYTNIKNEIHLEIKNISELVPDKNIRYLFEDSKGNIWVGTRYEGLIQVTNNKQFTVRQFGLSQGLMSNWIFTIAEDTKGNMWVGSNLGIEKLIPTERSFRVFNFSRVNNYFANIGAILPMKDHSLWFATNKGLVSIVDEETEKTLPVPVYITSVDLGDTSFNYGKYNTNKKVKLKHFQNYASFEFSAPGFVNEKQILYTYRLLGGTDTAWSSASNHHNVSYNSLQPGNYNFEVRTLGWNGEWGVVSSFLFVIRPPYWQTWWFYLLIGLIILSLFYALYLYRIRHLLNLQKVRNRIATDLHDDIGATLTNINMLSEISRKNLEQPKEAEKFLYRITEEVTSTSQALNDIIWSVNSRNDSMEEILLRIAPLCC
jgi:ligand-binding sensor domain-containing protein